MKVLIVYYSMYGHVHNMAEAVAEGVIEVIGAEVEMRRGNSRAGMLLQWR